VTPRRNPFTDLIDAGVGHRRDRWAPPRLTTRADGGADGLAVLDRTAERVGPFRLERKTSVVAGLRSGLTGPETHRGHSLWVLSEPTPPAMVRAQARGGDRPPGIENLDDYYGPDGTNFKPGDPSAGPCRRGFTTAQE
jgi:hypothetical protein